IEIGHNEVIVIQNSGFAGDANKLKNKTLELSSFFYLSQLAVQDIFQVAQVRTFANFVLHSTLLELEIQKLQKKSPEKEQLSLF
ncbi:MAG TPA: hypothetical protein PKD70_14240, partial [Saprospiraceae bacterium]|nr:hypothetical protein [Saprospiraceae bacterium]HMP15034.1 hypothetical protein [Saprospiraceae bacterium]